MYSNSVLLFFLLYYPLFCSHISAISISPFSFSFSVTFHLCFPSTSCLARISCTILCLAFVLCVLYRFLLPLSVFSYVLLSSLYPYFCLLFRPFPFPQYHLTCDGFFLPIFFLFLPPLLLLLLCSHIPFIDFASVVFYFLPYIPTYSFPFSSVVSLF